MQIGLLGWNSRTGLGYINKDIWDLKLATKWLAVSHPKLGLDEDHQGEGVTTCLRTGEIRKYSRFLDSIDVLLFAERPVIEHWDIVAEARRRKILVCCIPMMEWLPHPKDASWVRQVQMMWAPTQWSQLYLQEIAEANSKKAPCDWAKYIYGGSWGVNLDRFKFQRREVCEQFVYCNGFGGAGNRKGVDVIAKAAAMLPEAKVLVYSQKDGLPEMPANCEIIVENVADPAQLYARGSVSLAPSRWEGLGLQLYEAQASGMPVITTDAPPMNECRPYRLLPVASESMVHLHRRAVKAYEVDPVQLALAMARVWDRPIAEASMQAATNMGTYFNLARTLEALQLALSRRKRTP